MLTDGEVYEHMGIDAIWDWCKTVFVSAAGALLDMDAEPPTDWTRQAVRILDIATEQSRALRNRKLIPDLKQNVRKGTYWGIRTRIGDYWLPDAFAQIPQSHEVWPTVTMRSIDQHREDGSILTPK